MPATRYSLGLDYGTNSARALFVDVDSGREVGTGVAPFESGEDGVLLDERNPHLARQLPSDWEKATVEAVKTALDAARREDPDFSTDRLYGIGLDATASTPLPIDAKGRPLSENSAFADNLDAAAWLWKDHTAHAEAEEITELAAEMVPEYLARCGGTYSSEWFFAKLLRCVRESPEVMDAASEWVECGDWLLATLSSDARPSALPRNSCAAGHKGLFHELEGLPPQEFFTALSPELAKWCEGKLYDSVGHAAECGGNLTEEWATRLGLPPGVPISMGAVDAHVGAVGAGIRQGRLVKILGTSACDMAVLPVTSAEAPGIAGLNGVARDSILPGFWGVEAGQAAVGDIFGWFVREFGSPAALDHAELTRRAALLKPGETGLLALDWNNGNRSVLADPLLSGCLVGSTLRTTPSDVYRALLESTAFGARVIMERMVEIGIAIDEVVLCGGIAEKNELLLEIYADVWQRPLRRSRSAQTCALGAAVFGAVAGGVFHTVGEAQEAMTGLTDDEYRPDPQRSRTYDALYAEYRKLHDAFGGVRGDADLGEVMKNLLALQERQSGVHD